MKIVIVSDTHGDNSLLKSLLRKEYDADLFLHLGDVLDYPDEIAPFAAVKGNCDATLFHYPIFRALDLPSGKKAFFRHHPFDSEECEKLKQEGFLFLFHGHTHRQEDVLQNGVRVLSPGSLTHPRDGNYGSYLVFEATEKEEKWSFKTI